MRSVFFTASVAALLSAAPAFAQNAPTLTDDLRSYDVAAVRALPGHDASGGDIRAVDAGDASGLTMVATAGTAGHFNAGDVAAGRVRPGTDTLHGAGAPTSMRDAFQTSGVAPLRTADATAQDDGARLISRLPEPATWVMMILGFGAAGYAIRRGIRRSEARFTARVQRIAAGKDS